MIPGRHCQYLQNHQKRRTRIQCYFPKPVFPVHDLHDCDYRDDGVRRDHADGLGCDHDDVRYDRDCGDVPLLQACDSWSIVRS